MFRDLAVFQKIRIGVLPLDLDPTAQDARIGDDAKTGDATVRPATGGDSSGSPRAREMAATAEA